MTLRILAGSDRAARWRANGRVDVKLFESNSLFGEPVDVGRRCIGVAKAREIAPAHVIDEHENNVGTNFAELLLRCPRTLGRHAKTKGCKARETDNKRALPPDGSEKFCARHDDPFVGGTRAHQFT